MLEVEEEVKGKDVQDRSIKQLQNLAHQLHATAGDELAVHEAQQFIQQALKKRAKLLRGNSGSAFDDDSAFLEAAGDDEGVTMAIDCYALVNYPHLKANFAGHAGLSLARRLQGHSNRGCFQSMVSHTKDELKEGLTQLPSNLEPLARQTFKNILGWMHDKPIPESRRLSCSHDIMAAARMSKAMTDEVFCQVMKQLSNNPSRRSVLLGWKLFLQLMQKAVPSQGLHDFVRAFLAKHIRALRPVGGEALCWKEALNIARHCLSDFNCHVVQELAAATANEDDTKNIDVIVTFLDHSTRKVRVKEDATLVEVGDALASLIRLHRIHDFRFFHLLENDDDEAHDLHRMLPMNAKVKVLFEKWAAVEAKLKKRSHLLLKRLFMDSTEVLRAGDMTHATLTYREVLRDFLTYPVWEDKALVVSAAAAMLHAESDGVTEQARHKHDLTGEHILEKAMPAHLLRFEGDRKKWSQAITDKLTELEKETDPQEPRLQSMTRVLLVCQTMKLFGTMHWFAQQRSTASDKQALDNLPPPLKVNKLRAKADYWLCVNKAGIFFVPFDSGPGEHFRRSFFFDAEALDRVLRWGFKEDLLQLVVSACDQDNPAAGVQQFSISCHAPSAPDICFAIQCAKGKQP
jgi:hypothetical protein